MTLLKNTTDPRVEIRQNLKSESWKTVGDSSHLQSALLNLCINAVHAMPEGGTLSIDTRNRALDDAYCRASTFDVVPGNFIQIGISDTGCGISPENLSRIFDPFFTTKKVGMGSGLGLAMVYGTVKQYGGAVTVESELSSGTRFKILLPVAEEKDNAVRNQPEEPVPGQGRILLIDDEPMMRATGRNILSELGYSVIEAADGKEGLDKYRREFETLDLVILDMIMPVMNGFDCFRGIKEINPNARVLLSSGYTRDENVEQMFAEGLSGFIRKPFRMGELSHKISDSLHR